MDALLQHAQTLAEKTISSYLPIENRIAYVVSHGQSYASNGYAIRTQGVAEALNQHGFETLCFVRPGRPWELGSDVGPECDINGVRYIHSRWPQDIAPANEIEHLEQSVERFIELFSIYRPKVVLAASNYKVGLPAYVAAKRLNIPFYNEVRGFWELSRDAREPGYAKTVEFKQEAERDSFVAKNASAVFTLNQPMKDELTRRGVYPDIINIVPNGVSNLPEIKEPDQKLKQKIGVSVEDKVVGYIGSFNAYEGLDKLIHACENLIAQGIPVKLLLVGDGQPISNLNKENTVVGEFPWVIQVGRVSHEQAKEYYSLIDIVVIPRLELPVCQIVPPMKVVEAISYGKKVVASNVPALSEYKGYAGVKLYKAGSQAELIEAIKIQLTNGTVSSNESILIQKAIHQLVKNLNHPLAPLSSDITRPRLGKVASIDLDKADYQVASQLFYKQGNLNEALQILDNLVAKKAKLDKAQRDFHEFVKGLHRLQDGVLLPPRQSNAGLLTRKKHVLYCLHQSVPHATNGYSTRSHGIAVGLKQAGWNVRATTRTGFPWDANIKVSGKGYHHEEVEGITYVACAGWALNKTPLDRYLAETADHFLREAQTSGAEVIVAASNHITALPALIAARRLGLPFVYEVRGLWEVTQASTQPEWMDSDRYHLMKSLEAFTAREADLVVTLTDELADELVSRGTNRAQIEVVPNAVDANRFKPKAADPKLLKDLNIKPGIPVIGYAGSAVAYEGLELLLDALAELKKLKIAFYFVLVGDGKVIDLVKDKASNLNIEDICRFTGRVPFDQVPNYLACMDIMPIPRLSSAVTEMVSPLKPLEAMSMAKAVVLSDVSPHKIFAGRGERGRLFAKDNVASLVSALKDLIAKPDERQKLGEAARKWIEQERTWQHVTYHYSACIERMLLSQYRQRQKLKRQSKSLDQITLGLIGDQFTTDTLVSAVKIVPLSPDNWREELRQNPIDVMFVESAWKGNDKQWHKKVGYYSEEEFAPLTELLNHCRECGIPSVFWNKEDPVHFERFKQAAALCDHVFTTDSRRIIPYLATKNSKTVTASSCPFYASPKIHNLLPSTREWQPTAAYGGTYYGKRYPERTEYMDKIMSAAAPLGLTIYDRQHNDPDSPYKYPSGLGDCVAGSLEYDQMIQAYKAHPVQINVNSVLDSPTMFSRRVVETAACGAPLVSGPALGMNRYIGGAGHIVDTESEAAQALENLMHNPAYRWRNALLGARSIMRAHTTEHRLTQMLRTAGMIIKAPEPIVFALVTDSISDVSADRIVSQTILPKQILAKKWTQTSKSKLEKHDIDCVIYDTAKKLDFEYYLVADSMALKDLEPEDFEDLVWTMSYSPYSISSYSREVDEKDGFWNGVAYTASNVENRLKLKRIAQTDNISSLLRGEESNFSLVLRKPNEFYQKAPNKRPEKTVVIAGHDLKFIKPFYPYFQNSSLRVLLDFWAGHNQHNKEASLRLLQQADTVFCEWMLGNSIWYGNNIKPHQKIIGRLHLQEIDHALFSKIPFEKFDKVMFVGPHIMREAIKKNGSLKNNGIVVYNGVDIAALEKSNHKEKTGKVLGFVGIVPQRKRFDLALDILKELRKEDNSYTLRIKGKRPEDYSWMSSRKDEMSWYKNQYKRIATDPKLKGAVIFDGHGNDMPAWYSKVDYVLSTSDFESFHFTIADGASVGCIPVILPWEGASEIYPKEWISENVMECVDRIKRVTESSEYVKYSKENFNLPMIAEKISKFL